MLTLLRRHVVEGVSIIIAAVTFANMPGGVRGPPPSSALAGAEAGDFEHPVVKAIDQLSGGATPEVVQATRGSLIEVSVGHTSMSIHAGPAAVGEVLFWSGLAGHTC